MRKERAIRNPNNTCMMCLSKSKLIVIEIKQLGYGSGFDGWGTKIQLCQNCYEKTDSEWWELEIKKTGYMEEYEFENEIFSFINAMPLSGRELFYNRFAHGWVSQYIVKPQDWIDHKLGSLSYIKCKKIWNIFARRESSV